MINKNIPPILPFKEIIEWRNKDVGLLAKVAQIRAVLNNNFGPNLIQEFSRIRVYDALALPIILYGAKFGPLQKMIKKMMGINRDEIFQKNDRVHHF